MAITSREPTPNVHSMIFTNVIKATHLCNLGCRYCYNQDERCGVMGEPVLHRVLSQTFAYCAALSPSPPVVEFIWHGGEPLVAGVEFYRVAMAIQQREFRGVAYNNSLQTNATLIDAQWCDFFKEHRVRVSVSIDGPRSVNDAARVDSRGGSTFDRVLAGLALLKNAGVQLGVCVVLSRANHLHVDELYDFLAAEKLPFNVIPLNYAGAARGCFEDLGLTPREFAVAWTKLYDRWFDGAADYIYCSDFAFKTRAVYRGAPADCVGQRNCSKWHISTNPGGDVYPCATLTADEQWRYGNILDAPLAELFSSAAALRAVGRPADGVCVKCRWQAICHGGCMARSVRFFGTHARRDYYCSAYKIIYQHIADRLSEEGIGDGSEEKNTQSGD